MRTIKKSDAYYTPNGGSISMYLKEVSKTKMLDEVEIKKLLVLSKNGDKVATDKVVKSYQRFVFKLAKSYSHRNVELLSDLINEANIGLLNSIQTYKASYGVRFITHSVHAMRKEILSYLTFTEPSIKISNVGKTTNKVKDITNEFMLLNGRLPSTDEILDTLSEKYNIDIINEADIYHINLKSLNDENIFGDSNEDSNDLGFKSEDGMSSINEYEVEVDCDYNKTVINSAMGVLTDKERQVVMLLYGINQYKEFLPEEIGYQLNMTAEGIRMVGKRAVSKMREAIMEREYSI